MGQIVALKQSVESLTDRVLRKTEEYPKVGVDLWICNNGTAHVIPAIPKLRFHKKSPTTGCEFIGHYQHPCSWHNVIDDIEWVLHNITDSPLH